MFTKTARKYTFDLFKQQLCYFSLEHHVKGFKDDILKYFDSHHLNFFELYIIKTKENDIDNIKILFDNKYNFDYFQLNKNYIFIINIYNIEFFLKERFTYKKINLIDLRTTNLKRVLSLLLYETYTKWDILLPNFNIK